MSPSRLSEPCQHRPDEIAQPSFHASPKVPLDQKDDIVERWLHTLPPTPPSSSHPRNGCVCDNQSPQPRKRRRAMSDPGVGERNRSPKRARPASFERDEVAPQESASQSGKVVLSDVTGSQVLPPPPGSSAARSNSPTRQLYQLLPNCRPSINVDPPSLASGEHFRPLLDTMRGEMQKGYIPAPLKSKVEPFSEDVISECDIDHNDDRSEPELRLLWKQVDKIWQKAADCSREQADENAWCEKVVLPLLQLGLDRVEMLESESIKSQSIDPDLLPVAPQRGPINKKTDYAFSFSQHDPQVAPLYRRLRSAGQGDFLGHTTDKTTKRLLLFSGVEVKPENGGKSEATVQLSIWLSAALRHMQRLGQKSRTSDQADFPYDDLLPMPGFVVVGHDWHGFIARASRQGEEGRVDIIGPWKLLSGDTRDPAGILRLIKVVEVIGIFARDRFWPCVKDRILEPLLAK